MMPHLAAFMSRKDDKPRPLPLWRRDFSHAIQDYKMAPTAHRRHGPARPPMSRPRYRRLPAPYCLMLRREIAFTCWSLNDFGVKMKIIGRASPAIFRSRRECHDIRWRVLFIDAIFHFRALARQRYYYAITIITRGPPREERWAVPLMKSCLKTARDVLVRRMIHAPRITAFISFGAAFLAKP